MVLDPVGGASFSLALRCCRWGAQVLVVGFASGTIPTLQTNIALVKNLTVHGIYWGSYMTHDPPVLRQGLAQLLGWVADGTLTIHVSHRCVRRCVSSAVAHASQVSAASGVGSVCSAAAEARDGQGAGGSGQRRAAVMCRTHSFAHHKY